MLVLGIWKKKHTTNNPIGFRTVENQSTVCYPKIMVTYSSE